MPEPKYIVNSEALYLDLDHARRDQNISWRTLGTMLGMSSAVFTRLQHGAQPSGPHLISMFHWLRVDSRLYAKPNERAEMVDEREAVVIAEIASSEDVMWRDVPSRATVSA